MSRPPPLPTEEASWHERVRRRELRRTAAGLKLLAQKVQLSEDFASPTPGNLAKLIGAVAAGLEESIAESAPAEDLEHINVVLGQITTHLRYVERARVSQTPWSAVQPAERLMTLVAGPTSSFIMRPTWSYNYSLIGEFHAFYKHLVASWSWYPTEVFEKYAYPPRPAGDRSHDGDSTSSKSDLKKDTTIYCISFPRIERTNCLLHANWGHEVGHILAGGWVDADFGKLWSVDEVSIRQRIEEHVKQNLPLADPLFRTMALQEAVASRVRSAMEAARKGFSELLCDLVGVHLFGPSAVCAAMEFAALFSMDVFPLEQGYYPPWRYRIRKMLEYCDEDLKDDPHKGYPSEGVKALVELLRMGKRFASASSDTALIESNIVTREAYGFIEKHWAKAVAGITALLPTELRLRYRLCDRHPYVATLVERIQDRVPPNEASHLSEESAAMSDILASAWAYKSDVIKQNPTWGNQEEYALLFRLVLKGLESSYVHATWAKKIGSVGK